MADENPHSRYVKLTKEGQLQDITPGELNQPVEVPQVCGSLTGVSIGTITQSENIWRSFQALGAIAFVYSYSMILLEIQVGGNHYRPDLTKAAFARLSVVHKSLKIANSGMKKDRQAY